MSYGWHDRGEDDERDRQRGRAIVGLLLILLGLFFLASEQFGSDLGQYGWPIFVIAPGVFLLVVGLAIPHEGGLGAAIPGGLVTSVGLVLAFQYATDAYGSWAYMWALVAPGSVGATLTLYGLLHRRADLLDAGLRTAAVGLALFIGFGLVFENILGVDNLASNNPLRDAFPLLAVALGALIVLWNVLPHPSGKGRPPETPGSQTPPGA